MHKEEASYLFSVLGNPNSVKIAKMLYNKGDMDISNLEKLIKTTPEEFMKALSNLLEAKLVLLEATLYKINKPLLENLLAFIVTPCGCCKKS